MYLSKLEIVGFKSFANKVNVSFDSGISAIVGPNGCGKTNIVDAIRWVLGEQRYSALRSDKMEDVIFNGTKSRKALGMAEASLVIENTKGILPSEYTQVTIGRRVYRSGESEYLLNKVPCRLKDILDLFMDTGMGADAYSVIELKMIETILSDKTDERRRLFEEAAGVTKYKHRRKAAYRKLESVQDDLLRLNDIVAEVQKSVATLERQARRAEQYEEVKAKLRAMEIDLMEREYAQLLGRCAPLEEKLGALRADKSQIDIDLSREESRLDGLRMTLLETDKRLAEAQRDVSEHHQSMHRVEEKNAVAAERIKALRANIVRFERDKEALRAEMERIADEKVRLEQEASALAAREESAVRDLDERKQALAEFEVRLNAAKHEVQRVNERTIGLVQSIAEKQTEEDRKKGRLENLQGRTSHASEESARYQGELSRLDSLIEQLTADDRGLRRKFAEVEVKLYDGEQARQDLGAQIEALRRKEGELTTEAGRRTARIDFLRGLIESAEGVADGVRYLTRSERWTPSRHTLVADLLSADDRYLPAIEAALGDLAGLIVVDTVEDAESGIAILRDDQRGKATFVCLDRLPEVHRHARLPAIAGVVGWAVDLVRHEPEFARLFRLILDRVLIVETVEAAVQASRRLPGVRCISLDGEVRTGIGVTRGGSRRQDEGGMIGKHQQIESLETELRSIEEQRAAVAAEIREASARHEAIDLKALAEDVKSVEKEMSAIEVRIAQVAFEKKRASDIIEKNAVEIAGTEQEMVLLRDAIAAGAPALEQLKLDKDEVERQTGAAGSELHKLEEEWNLRSSEVNALGVEIVRVRGELQNLKNTLQRGEDSRADAEEALGRYDEEIAFAGNEIRTADEEVAGNSGELEKLREVHADLEARRADIEREGAAVRDEAHTIELAIKDRRRSHDDSLRVAHDYELKLTDLRGKAEHLVARAREEFELELTLKTYPEDEFVDFAALRDEIQGHRDKIKSLGNINFAAFEEFTNEKQRMEFLTTQRNDLLEAEKTLLATIEEINQTAQTTFLSTFEKIRTNFIDTFKSLFDPGDECDLRLEENVDPLEARIEIVAKPRGKRPTSIDLLSGGEKTLTATALLFAIYLVKPSPFCILDEVDAPLDDANVDRFTRILRKFSNNTQFLVVTHNKRTMEAASALYGVTMEEEGISKLVTVRFNKQDQIQSAAVSSA
jgi:chromosome segregation protein